MIPKDLLKGNPIQRVWGFGVSAAPFPFYRTLIVELVRAVTLVNHKRHPVAIRADGESGFQLLAPGEAAFWDPQNTNIYTDSAKLSAQDRPADKQMLEHVVLRISGETSSTSRNFSSRFTIAEHETFQLFHTLDAEHEQQNLSNMHVDSSREKALFFYGRAGAGDRTEQSGLFGGFGFGGQSRSKAHPSGGTWCK